MRKREVYDKVAVGWWFLLEEHCWILLLVTWYFFSVSLATASLTNAKLVWRERMDLVNCLRCLGSSQGSVIQTGQESAEAAEAVVEGI